MRQLIWLLPAALVAACAASPVPVSIDAPGRLPPSASPAPPLSASVDHHECDATCRALVDDIRQQADDVLQQLRARRQVDDP